MAHIYKASWSGLYLQVSSSLVSCYEQLMNNSNNLVTHKLTHYTSFVFCPQLTSYSFTYKIYTKGDTVRGLDLFFYFQCWVFYKATACKLPHPFFCGFGAWFSAENLVPPAKASYFSENCENKQHCHRSVQVFSSDLLRYPKSRHVFFYLWAAYHLFLETTRLKKYSDLKNSEAGPDESTVDDILTFWRGAAN